MGVTEVGEFARIGLGRLIAGVALLNDADAGGPHPIGIACLLGFVRFDFRAVGYTALRDGLTHITTHHQRT